MCKTKKKINFQNENKNTEGGGKLRRQQYLALSELIPLFFGTETIWNQIGNTIEN